MTYDPLSEIIDESLSITSETVLKLEIFRASEKFFDLPATNTAEEQSRLSNVIDQLLDRLIAGVISNPSKLRVMSQFQPSLEAVSSEDTECREHFGNHIERIMDILNIESSNGMLSFYL